MLGIVRVDSSIWTILKGEAISWEQSSLGVPAMLLLISKLVGDSPSLDGTLKPVELDRRVGHQCVSCFHEATSRDLILSWPLDQVADPVL